MTVKQAYELLSLMVQEGKGDRVLKVTEPGLTLNQSKDIGLIYPGGGLESDRVYIHVGGEHVDV